MTVSILLPTYNEEENIAEMIDSIRNVSKDWDILIVDGGSTDRTIEIARNKGTKIFVFPERGKGKAVGAAFMKLDAEKVVLLDADMSYPPSEIPGLLKKLDECEVVVESRFRGNIEEGAMKGINRFGNQGLTFLANLLYGSNISDLCSGLWAFRKSAYKKMEITAPHFELEANFFSECIKKNLTICEVPINYKKRGGKAKISVFDGLKIGIFLLLNRI